ncbi:DUF2859 domain-containing protein, partial [Pseudomonas aeruginosa]|uniref:DUF2859 domain-containing protein n=1 Tax=Pseudomonas aeruginosa TaxID=287 RepID=UPI00350E39C9
MHSARDSSLGRRADRCRRPRRRLGGASALPYYQGLDSAAIRLPHQGLPTWEFVAQVRFPVRSARCRQAIKGQPSTLLALQPLFLVGDDHAVSNLLKERGNELRGLHAVGLAVNVASEARLAEIR